MHKKTTLLILILMCTTHLYSDHWRSLIGISNKSPYKVTVQTSERKGNTAKIVLLDGSEPETQNVEFDVATVKSMNLVVPENSWDGDATIHVRVNKPNDLLRFDIKKDSYGPAIYIHEHHESPSNKNSMHAVPVGDQYFKLIVDNEGNIVFNQ